ncbi:unnamed protein product, partial [Polarella glacialis]
MMIGCLLPLSLASVFVCGPRWSWCVLPLVFFVGVLRLFFVGCRLGCFCAVVRSLLVCFITIIILDSGVFPLSVSIRRFVVFPLFCCAFLFVVVAFVCCRFCLSFPLVVFSFSSFFCVPRSCV